MEVLVRRLPVFDRSEQLYGYELLLQRIGERPSGSAEPPPEQVVVDVFLGIGLDQVAPDHRAFITVDRDILLGDAVRLLPKDRVVLQLVGPLSDDDELLAACDRLVWSGYRFSVESDAPEKLPESLLRLAEIVKLDVSRCDRRALPEVVDWLRPYHARLMARHVRNREERDAFTKLGFELFEGYQSGVSKTLTRRSLPTDHLLIFRLLKKIRDPKATDTEIEDILRGDVALSYKLLRMVNSAAFGGREIWSIGHALRLLGREQVARWLGLLLVVGGEQHGVRAELTSLSLVRARMCELLATASGVPRAGGSLFLVGMLSLLDHLLEAPMDQLVESMELAPDVRQALLKREDYYGAVLKLIEAYEEGSWDAVVGLAAGVGVAHEALPRLYVDSLAWAREQQGSSLQ
jgi:EAL and modified HD-GYP domain-containing signal transduction protein